MKTSESQLSPSLAQCVAGEDLRVNEYIAVLTTTGEFLSNSWDRCDLPPEAVVRVRFIPAIAGVPLKVFGICLPFVYTKHFNGNVEIIDMRCTQLARLNKECAKEVWKQRKSITAGLIV